MPFPITTVTLDLWQTLILDTPELGRQRSRLRLEGVRRLLAEAGHDFAFESIQQAYRACWQTCDHVREAGGDVSFREQVEILLTKLRSSLPSTLRRGTMQAIAEHYARSIFPHPPLVAPGALETLRDLKTAGYRTGLICNTGATPGSTQREFLAQVGILQYLDTATFSDEVRASKPNPVIFRDALRKLGASPQETVHVGDHPRNDVCGAKELGLRAIMIGTPDPAKVVVEPDARITSLYELPAAVASLVQ